MSRTYELSFKLGAQMAGNFAKTMSSASGTLATLNNRIADINKQSSSLKSLTDLRTKVAETSRAYIQASQNVARLGRELAMTENPTKEQIRNFEKAKREVSQTKDKLNTQREALRKLNAEMGTGSKSTKDLVNRQQQLAAAAEKARAAQAALSKTMAAQDANMAKRGDLRGQLFDAFGLAASLSAPIAAAAKFESSMADVNKVVDQSPLQSKEMADSILNMSKSIPIAAEGLAQIVAAGGQAGIARDDLLSFASSAAQMGVAFDVTADQAGDMMAKWRTAFKLSQDQVVGLADQINYLSNTSAASAPLISDVVTRIGGLGQIAGFNSGEIAAMGSALVAVGTPSEVAATGMQNMMLAMTAGRSATKAQSAAFERLGYDAEYLAKLMQEDAQGAVLNLLGSIKQLSEEERPAVLTEIFGKESIKSIGQLLNNTDILEKNFKAVGDSSKYSGSMLKEFQARSATTTNNVILLKNRVTALGISLGSILLPGVNKVVSGMGWMADMAAGLAGTFPTVTAVIVGGTAALIALRIATIAGGYAFTFMKGAVLQVVKIVQMARTAWLLYTGAMVASTTTSKTAIIVSKAMAAAQWLVNAATAAFPGTWIVAAIVGVIAAGVALYKNLDVVSEYGAKAWAAIKNFGVIALDGLKTAIINFTPLGWFMQAFGLANGWLSNFSLFESGSKIMQTLGQGILSAASSVISSVKSVFSKVREYLPFSDAKVGPFSELTKSGAAIMGTLADGVNSTNALESSMSNQLGSAGRGGISSLNQNMGRSSGSGSKGGDITVTISNITIGGDSQLSQSDVRKGVAQGSQDIVKEIQRAIKREERLSYG